MRSLARRSASSTSSRVEAAVFGSVSRTSWIDSGMARNGALPSRKAATASSFAALRAAGAVPPASSARVASERQGNFARSGGAKSSCIAFVKSIPGIAASHFSG